MGEESCGARTGAWLARNSSPKRVGHFSQFARQEAGPLAWIQDSSAPARPTVAETIPHTHASGGCRESECLGAIICVSMWRGGILGVTWTECPGFEERGANFQETSLMGGCPLGPTTQCQGFGARGCPLGPTTTDHFHRRPLGQTFRGCLLGPITQRQGFGAPLA